MAEIADFEKMVVKGGRESMRRETAEETRVSYLIISHDGVAAEGFRKVSGEFAGVGRYRDTKNLGRHLYSTELTGLEAMVVCGSVYSWIWSSPFCL